MILASIYNIFKGSKRARVHNTKQKYIYALLYIVGNGIYR